MKNALLFVVVLALSGYSAPEDSMQTEVSEELDRRAKMAHEDH